MGKFDGIMIASDWDNTLFCNGKIPDANLKAIKYFQDNGGLFTACSGRYYGFLKSYMNVLNFNTYLITYNGAMIVSPDGNECLYCGFCDEYLFSLLDEIVKSGIKFENIRFFIDSDDFLIKLDNATEYEEAKSNLKTKNVFKAVIVYENEEDAVFNRNMLYDKNILHDYLAVRSWGAGLEIIKKDNSKGVAVRRVADAVGAHLLITAGDFENDIELIKAADIGYAVGNAVDELKSIADRITIPCSEGAIARIIYDIESELDKL